jgi:hypothetical protein
MAARATALLGMVLVVSGCGSERGGPPAMGEVTAAAGGSVAAADAGSGAGKGGSAGGQDVQGAQGGSKEQNTPAEPTLGGPGSHVWFESSIAVELATVWAFDGWGVNPPQSGQACWRLDREALSVAQLATLAAVTLIPLNDSCTADGFRFREVTVYDVDGTSRSYRDTGCDYLMVEGARGMLDSVTPDFSLFPDEMGTTCAPRL